MAVGGDLIIKEISNKAWEEGETAEEFPLASEEPVDPKGGAGAGPEAAMGGAPVFDDDEAAGLSERFLGADEDFAGGFSSQRSEEEKILCILLNEPANGADAKRTLVVKEKKMQRLVFHTLPADVPFLIDRISSRARGPLLPNTCRYRF